MGEVWLAEQQVPLRRAVALKIIKRGLDTQQVVARFEAERRALALMDHPCVAKVYDAGSTPDGRPFFAMEYVQGVPLTEHCDRHRLTTRERLVIFVRVCEGVQHAHQKAIIHRDLKPSNVLVAVHDDRPTPKVIDFGVAKATAQRLTERTLFTEQGVLIGTPEYMSPEQAEMTAQDVDTRTDVYSLGVMLYELLVGALPFDSKVLRAAGLDWITMKAIEKDRARRYGSPADLAADIERHLTDQPVLAGPPSVGYRARKFVVRHTVGVGVAAFIAVSLLAFAGVMSWQAERIARERDRADREVRTATQALKFLTGLFKVSDPSESRGNQLTAREVLDRGSQRLATELADEPAIRATLMLTIGEVYRDLGLFDQAVPLFEQSMWLRRKTLGDVHPETLAAIGRLGSLLTHQGKFDAAERYCREALEGRRRVLGDDHPDTLESMVSMASLVYAEGKTEEALPYLRQALEGFRRLKGNDDPVTLTSCRNVGAILGAAGKFQEAGPYFREALEGRRRVLGNDHPGTLESLSDMGYVLLESGKFHEAEPYYREALEGRRRVLGNDHPDTLISINDVGMMLQREGKPREAEAYFLEALAGWRRVLGSDHPDTLNAMLGVGGNLLAQGRYAEAEPYYREALAAERRVLGNDHYYTLQAMHGLYGVLRRQGKLQEAEAYIREALQGRRRVQGADHPDTIAATDSVGDLLYLKGRLKEADPYLREAVDKARRVLGNGHPVTLDCLHDLTELYMTEGKLQEAGSLLEDAVVQARALPPGHGVLGAILSSYGRWLTLMKRYPEAESALVESHQILTTTDADLACATESHLAALYTAWAMPAEAAKWRSASSQP